MAPTPSTRPLETAWGAVDEQRIAALLAPPRSALPRLDLRGCTVPAAARAPWDRLRRDALTSLLGRAGAARGRRWPQPTAGTWARVHRDGDRATHEQLVFDHAHRLTRAVVAAAVCPDDHPQLHDLLDEVADGVLLRCEQSSWCWPAHDDARRRTGAVLPDASAPVLDLGAGEVAGQLAWTDHLLGDRLDVRWPGLRARVRLEVRRRVVDSFLTRRDWPWSGLDGDVHNWNPWIHGNVLAAALVLLDGGDEGAQRALAVALAVRGLDRYVEALPEDGATDEGFDYWFEGACRALEALEVVRAATGGALGWTVVPRLRATTGFPGALHLGGAWHASSSDSRARAADGLPWWSLFAAGRRAGDQGAAAHAAATASALARQGRPLLDERAGLARTALALADSSWREALADPPAAPLARSSWLSSVQVLVARPAAGSSQGLSLVVKGGDNGEHHNHCDVGSVVVALDGVPVVVDPGRPTYTAKTFGERRYDLWPMRSAWHSAPVLRGAEQGVGRAFAARDVELLLDDDEPTGLALDLVAAHPPCGVRSWRRTARLERGGVVVISDAWELHDAWELRSGPPPAAGPSAVHLVLAGEVSLDGGCAVVEALDGAGRVRLAWSGDAVAASLEERRLDDPLLTAVWGERLTRLRLELSDTPVGCVEVTAAREHGR
ncbi:heparinase II/III domain-containing protein [Quadrisphaera setariae]|uniref:Heparinase II/III-like C-terminal domain-containing protein n=1 Tax=Quadrisphaera setariae TaxID=2593304 RepID=A0A5C8ZEM6_9ACTN|nr:heparinase II/III family protein [Quadrisphaera setariae]TXR56505.1 hypothetical protein FMM08_10540 [Quadrisphaera setariae]